MCESSLEIGGDDLISQKKVDSFTEIFLCWVLYVNDSVLSPRLEKIYKFHHLLNSS